MGRGKNIQDVDHIQLQTDRFFHWVAGYDALLGEPGVV
jgi:hypothetical protein